MGICMRSERTEARYFTLACLTKQHRLCTNTPNDVICQCECHHHHRLWWVSARTSKKVWNYRI